MHCTECRLRAGSSAPALSNGGASHTGRDSDRRVQRLTPHQLTLDSVSLVINTTHLEITKENSLRER